MVRIFWLPIKAGDFLSYFTFIILHNLYTNFSTHRVIKLTRMLWMEHVVRPEETRITY